jgi:hypothetical protein
MLRGMPVLGGVAATDMPANQAEAQVDPLVAELDAFLAYMLARAGYLNLIKMSAFNWHLCLLDITLSRSPDMATTPTIALGCDAHHQRSVVYF